jgi:hypothetical protein
MQAGGDCAQAATEEARIRSSGAEEKGEGDRQVVVGLGLEARWVEVGLRLSAGDLQGADGVQDIDENLER